VAGVIVPAACDYRLRPEKPPANQISCRHCLEDTLLDLLAGHMTCGFVAERVAARNWIAAWRYPLATPTPLPRQDWGVHAEQHCL
jgi:hypothetical protein